MTTIDRPCHRCNFNKIQDSQSENNNGLVVITQDAGEPREGRRGGAGELLHPPPGGVHHLWPDLCPVVPD